MKILVSLSGLPGVGKTTLAKELAKRVNAIHLRVDSVETALKHSMLKVEQANDAGYLAIASVAIDNLLLGFDVIADTVNPIEITRKLWADTAASGNAYLLNVEVVCSDIGLHRDRVEARASDIEELTMPDWQQVCSRTFEPWQQERLVVDTSTHEINECVFKITEQMAKIGTTVR